MAILVFKKFDREFRKDRSSFNVTARPRYRARYHIFVKNKHKIIEFLGTLTLSNSRDLVFELNYKKCFYWVGRLRLDYTALDQLHI